jgi:hypothetical protein
MGADAKIDLEKVRSSFHKLLSVSLMGFPEHYSYQPTSFTALSNRH